MVISSIIFIVLALLLSYLYYRKTTPNISFSKKIFLISLRTITYFVLFLLIYSPIYNNIRKKKIPENIIILNDDSNSVNLKKLNKQTILRDSLIKKISDRGYSIKSFDFSDGLKGNPKNTLLIKTLQQLKNKHLLKYSKSIILNSDGYFHDSDLTTLQNFPIPIFPILRIKNSPLPDLKIEDLKINDEVFRDEKTPIKIKIKSTHFSGKAEAIINYDSKEIRKNIFLDSLKINEINLNAKFSKIGIQKISIEIRGNNLKKEINFYNNQLIRNIIVKNNRNKVIVVSDELNWDAAYIIKSISGEKRWKSKFYLFRNGNFYLSQKRKSLPKMLETANLLVIVQTHKLQFTKQQITLITNFVKNGGGLLFQGKFNPELKKILPIKTFYSQENIDIMTWTNNIADYSIYSNLKNADIPPISFWEIEPKINVKILARSNNYPTIISSKYANGKILYLNCLNLWKWELSGKNQSYFNFMNHTIKWLGSKNSKLFEATLPKYDFDLNESIQIGLEAVDQNLNPRENIEAKISVFNSKKKLVFSDFFTKKNQLWKIQIPSLPKDSYHFEVIEEKTGLRSKGDFVVNDNNLEYKDVNWNESALQYISEITNGKIIRKVSDLDLTKPHISEETSLIEIYLYKKWYFFLIFIFTFTLELFIRKRNGLL